jgi:hypothetical protein
MTLEQIVTTILEAINQLGNEPLYQRLKDEVRVTRALMLRQDDAKNYAMTDVNTQDLGIIKMEVANISSLCDEDIACQVFKSIEPIPTPVRFQKEVALTYVGVTEKRKPFAYAEPSYLSYLLSNPMNKNNTYFYLKDNYVYVLNPKNSLIGFINVEGCFEDPEAAYNYNTCNKENCFFDESPYPLAADITVRLIALILESRTLAAYKGDLTDITTNG